MSKRQRAMSRKASKKRSRQREPGQAESTDLLEILAPRTDVDRTIVELLAAAYHSLTRTELARCLARMKVKTPGGKRIDTKTLDPLLTSLAEAGLVVYQARAWCPESIRERLARRLAADGRLDGLADAVDIASPVRREEDDWEGAVRSVRCAVYSGHTDRAFELLARCEEQFRGRPVLPQFCAASVDEAWLGGLEGRLRLEVLVQVLRSSVIDLVPATGAFDLLDAELSAGATATPEQQRVHGEQLMLRGRMEDAARLLDGGAHPAEAATLALALGDRETAVAGFAAVPKPAGCRRRTWVVPGLAGLLHALALATSEDAQHRLLAGRMVKAAARDWVPLAEGFNELKALLEFRRRGVKCQAGREFSSGYHRQSPFSRYGRGEGWSDVELWIGALVDHWVYEKLPKETARWLKDAVARADQAGYTWIAAELAELLARGPRPGRWRSRVASWRRAMGGQARPLADLLRIKPAWESKLELLGGITAPAARPPRDASATGADSRLVWFVSARHGYLDIEPRIQTRKGKGRWTKGRKVALKRLFELDPELDFLTEQDRRVCATISREVETSGWGKYTEVSYTLGDIDTYRALAGHPALLRSPGDPTPVELVFAEPRLVVDEQGRQLRITLHPEKTHGECTVVEDGPNRIEVYVATETQRRVAEVLDGEAVVPVSARHRVEEVVAGLAPVITVQSDIAPAGETDAGKSVAAAGQLNIELRRIGAGLEVRARTFPLGGDPACVPGQGQRLVVGTVGGEHLQAERDLERERASLEAFSAACPALERAVTSPATWRFEELGGSLTFLLELARVEDQDLVVRWSDAGRFDVTPELDADSLDLRIRSVSGGFSIGGQLRTGAGSPVPLSDLMGLLEDSPARFIALNDGRFLALTDAFHRRLRRMARYARAGRGRAVKIPALTVPAIEPVVEAAKSTRSDARWKAHVARIREAASLEAPVPSTLKADLRAYQEDGFRWMARLAAWGAGACLADDMGLGKTVQALAAALLRAADGPTLVVAPTSVCAQWLAEAARFAPTLHARQLGGGDRRSVVAALGPRDLLVSSYGLLVTERELLEGVHWATVILDEAQAIKNPRTKRFKAAIRLRGDFRLVTTGTPIENRLEELWSLFEFINPGLLGLRVAFERRFAAPIEARGDRGVRADLRRLVLPFVLRRNKSEVLSELPPRSEIELPLEMGPDEAALYEAMRRQALDELAGAIDQPGAARFKILAWITRLRRACCNPGLVVEDGVAPASCKLATFKELVGQLRDSGHKALVFSQFVGHLTILRQWLDEQHIPYQYLDGGTPAPSRERRVAAFQAGEGDLFLISLRAGGLGLNLTAADYVIHMDPWWNPAVEDQATDRAHRIGQTRPVTIYRLIARDTIEERIVALHRHKRDIADKILEGADVAGRLSAEELLALLQL